MIRHKDSHLDHGLAEAQVAYIFEHFADATGFFVKHVVLPEELGTAPCALFGPLAGDPPVPDSEVVVRQRGDRAWMSRCIVAKPRQTNFVTVIAGPHEDSPCVLYTAFGGPLTPQEPGDPTCKDAEVSRGFWAQHALAVEE